MFAKGLSGGAFGIEPVEHLLETARRDAGTTVLHCQFSLAFCVDAEMEADLRAMRGKRHGIAKQIIEDLDNTAILNRDMHRHIGQLGNKIMRVSCCPARLDKTGNKIAKIDGGSKFGRHLVVDTAGARDIGDQPVEARHIAQNDIHQFLLLRRIGNPADRLGRTAKRGQRVLELMGHIRRETCGRRHPLLQLVCHIDQRFGQLADFVTPTRQPLHACRQIATTPQIVGFRSKVGNRPGDGARKPYAECNRDQRDNAEKLDEDHIDLGDLLFNLATADADH